MSKTLNFSNRHKLIFITLIILGTMALGISIFQTEIAAVRIWANILLNNFLFLAIALFGVLFIVIHTLGDSAWHLSVQRVAEAMSSFLPVAALLMFLIYFGMHDIYHWTHSDHLDEVLLHKTPYLNVPFFFLRMFVYFTGWIVLTYMIRKNSLRSDYNPDLKYIRKNQILSGVFIVFFAITSSASAWDWLMSIDAHWFSTLFGWYIFSGLFVLGMSVLIMLVLFLRKAGYLGHVTDEHLHDLGKYLFAFSIFWMYLWFSQFLLIWYGNIPEETVYYVQRLENFRFLFFLNIGLNFFAPFLILMTRKSKRIYFTMFLASAICFIGHWLDLYLAIMPGSAGNKATIGFLEVGMTMGYAGIFLFLVFRALSKSSLLPENHPYIKEAFDYENIG